MNIERVIDTVTVAFLGMCVYFALLVCTLLTAATFDLLNGDEAEEAQAIAADCLEQTDRVLDAGYDLLEQCR